MHTTLTQHNAKTALVQRSSKPFATPQGQSQAKVEQADSFKTSVSTEPENKDLRAAFDKIYNSGGDAKARLLEDNTEAWTARWKVLESAEDSINTQYFCWDHDVFGKAMLGHIFKKARQGVDTRVMVDATGDTFGTRGFKAHIGGRDYLQEVTALPNAEAKVYHPHYKKVIDGLLHVGKSYIAASNHDKILEVDGERAITGGRNIGYEYFAEPEDTKNAWRDTDVYFEGEESALALRTAFETEYSAPWINEKVRPDLLGNWVKRDAELLGAYAIMDDWIKADELSDADKTALRNSPEKQKEASNAVYEAAVKRLPSEGIDRKLSRREHKKLKELAADIVKYPELKGSYNQEESPIRDSEVKILDRTSIVSTATDEIGPKLLNLVKSAKKKILIENPYIVLSQPMLDSLKDAGERGVEIILGTNSPASTDSDVTQAFFLEDWPKVLATTPNMKMFVITGERKLHAKSAVIDDEASLVSTYNLDLLSTEINSEVGALIWGKEFANDQMKSFEKDFNNPDAGVAEYTIKRDKDGTPVRSDGKPVLNAKGEIINDPEVTFGPANHLSPEVMAKYDKKTKNWNFLRKFVPQLSSLETFNFADS